MRYETMDDIRTLVSGGAVETPTLEFKQSLPFTSRSQRVEALKDLTGMGNGGGGTVIFGVRESEGEIPVAEAITPLVDRSVVSRLENAARSSVRPPILMDYRVLDTDGGFVLVVDVEPSRAGPYMVEGYGSHRYFSRSMSSTTPMTEQQVRDAYVLAARAREHRPAEWDDHSLPMPPGSTATPWLTVSALPDGPLRDVLDLVRVDPSELAPRGHLFEYMSWCGFGGSLPRLGRWADGFWAEDSMAGDAREVVRLHRDGAVGVALELPATLSPVEVPRALNAVLTYFAWLWQSVAMARPVEMVICLERLQTAAMLVTGVVERQIRVVEPRGVAVPRLRLTQYTLPHDLLRAPVRHAFVMHLADQIHHAFGRRQAELLFRHGQMYGRDATPLGLAIAGNGVWDNNARQRGFVHDDGAITNVQNSTVATLIDGAAVNRTGDTLAVVEMAPGHGCPDDFLPRSLTADARARVPGQPGDPFPAAQAMDRFAVAPQPSGRWSEATLLDVLA